MAYKKPYDVQKYEKIASVVKEQYGYLDSLKLNDWAWEFIRRDRDYINLYDQIVHMIKDTPTGISIRSVLLSKKLESLFTRMQEGFNLGPSFNLYINHRDKKIGLNAKYKRIKEDKDENIESEIVNGLLGIPNPKLRAIDLDENNKRIIVAETPVAYQRFDYDYCFKEKNDGTFPSQSDVCNYIVEFIQRLTVSGAEDTIYFGVSANETQGEISVEINKILEKELKKKRKHINNWKYYVISYELSKKYSNSEIAYILSEIYGDGANGEVIDFDSNNAIQYYKAMANMLHDGNYKKYFSYRINSFPYVGNGEQLLLGTTPQRPMFSSGLPIQNPLLRRRKSTTDTATCRQVDPEETDHCSEKEDDQ
ncbi:MAG: hypothetical protein HQK96_05820 [Nitrospirae bacterium]|nr:hypothetical protein [Nitrospirota bacterium]